MLDSLRHSPSVCRGESKIRTDSPEFPISRESFVQNGWGAEKSALGKQKFRALSLCDRSDVLQFPAERHSLARNSYKCGSELP